METKVLDALIRQGPMTVKRISKMFNVSKTQIRGILWSLKNTCLTWRAPLSIRKKPIWSYSETRIRPRIARKEAPVTDP